MHTEKPHLQGRGDGNFVLLATEDSATLDGGGVRGFGGGENVAAGGERSVGAAANWSR